MCSSRDLFVLKHRIIQLFRSISPISMPHKVNLSGINMFKKHIDEFSKNLENSDILKCVTNLPVEKIECLVFFKAGKAHLITPVPHALANFI